MAGLVALMTVTSAPAGAVPHAAIVGSGSGWAGNAVNVAIANVASAGLNVTFTSNGSTQGRRDFGNGLTDFAITDTGYQGVDPITGNIDVPCPQGTTFNCRPYAYLPIVAGATTFPYHLVVDGKQVRSLRLSGLTIAKIFTGAITNWNDPSITLDNNGYALPSLAIVPVTHSEGSGATYHLTSYLNSQYPATWQPFGIGATEYFPSTLANVVQENGSAAVANFLGSDAVNGSIGYDEYSYALAKNMPVAKLENAAGYYAFPSQYNVAVALTKAKINNDSTSPNYLLADLSDVYTNPDTRSYPLSSYSYMIIPTARDDPRIFTAKRQTLADFVFYTVCQGQEQIGSVGYSPLPLNLVQASFDQIAKLKTADTAVDLTSRDVTQCNNPTFVSGDLSGNHLAVIDPAPPLCDSVGNGPCGVELVLATSPAPTSPAPTSPAPTSPAPVSPAPTSVAACTTAASPTPCPSLSPTAIASTSPTAALVPGAPGTSATSSGSAAKPTMAVAVLAKTSPASPQRTIEPALPAGQTLAKTGWPVRANTLGALAMITAGIFLTFGGNPRRRPQHGRNRIRHLT